MKKLPEEAAFEPERMPTSMSMQEGIDMSERNKALEDAAKLDDPELIERLREDGQYEAVEQIQNLQHRIRALSTPEPQDSGLARELEKLWSNYLAQIAVYNADKDNLVSFSRKDAAHHRLQAWLSKNATALTPVIIMALSRHGNSHNALRSQQAGGGELATADNTLELDCYDTGLLGDGGGGDVEWWQDYIRAELARAHEFYSDQITSHMEASDDER